ncbi:L-rhamnose mutarotase [Streptacidiphilus sp. 4-A2]|nr:L-rhamnose mutarotase [Streptacidiphilus sp. 4-A2]
MRIALHTRVRADRIQEYEAAHREVPPALTDAMRAAGVSEWTIWRSGTDLFHLIVCEDYRALIGHLSALPVNRSWQLRMTDLLEVVHDYSAAGAEQALPVVWEL